MRDIKLNDGNFEKLKQMQNNIIVNAFAIPIAISIFSQSNLSASTLIANTVNLHIRNNQLIVSLYYMSGMSLEKVVETCQKLPYDLADIQAYYRMYGEFPE